MCTASKEGGLDKMPAGIYCTLTTTSRVHSAQEYIKRGL
jgi:hypothetical protein